MEAVGRFIKSFFLLWRQATADLLLGDAVDGVAGERGVYEDQRRGDFSDTLILGLIGAVGTLLGIYNWNKRGGQNGQNGSGVKDAEDRVPVHCPRGGDDHGIRNICGEDGGTR